MPNAKQTVALTSIAASAALTIAKAVVGFATGSLAILSEAAHSLIDLAATVMTYFAVRIADMPADAEHHYGHGKVESLSALAETALLFVLSGVVIWEAGLRLVGVESHAVDATIAAFAVMAISIVVDFGRSRALSRAAAEHRSEALEADALHFSSDMWSSAAVILGLVGLKLGYAWAAHHRNADRHGARRRGRAHHRGGPQGQGRGRRPPRARAPGGPDVVRRPRHRGEPLAPARPGDGAQAGDQQRARQGDAGD
jgi:Co/Zn/Cd efflux system component